MAVYGAISTVDSEISLPDNIALPKDTSDILEEETETIVVPDTAIKSNEKLQPADKIFFHTTPLQNVAGLREHGLMAHDNTDTLGRDLLYSLAFAEEYNDISKLPVRNFALTIWQNSRDIKKRIMPSGSVSDSQYTAAGKLDSDSVPGTYQQNLADRRFGHTGAAADIKTVSAEHMLATIPITEASQQLLAQCKLDFFNNTATGEEIEQRLLTFIQIPDSGVQFGARTTPEDIAHDLAARIQQETARYEVSTLAQNALQKINALSPATTQLPSDLTNEIAEIRTKAERVNDPLSARYISIWANRCQKALAEKGLTATYENAKSNVEDVYEWADLDGVNYNDLWSGNDGWKLVRKIRDSSSFA